MTVVIDTNVVLQARAPGHSFHRILEAWKAGKFVIAVSTGILLEYEEIITDRTGAERWRRFAEFLDAVSEAEGNFCHVEPSFRWRLIIADPDDDKFADCAIAAAAEWIITEDGHFSALAASGHKPRAITPADFIARFLTP